MLKDIICFLLGHKLWTNIYSGKTAVITSRLTGQDIKVPIMTARKNEVCPRCGKAIKWEGK